MELEPLHSLEKRPLLRKLDVSIRDIATDGKAVFHAAEQVDLVLLTSFGQDFFGFVALGSRKNAVRF